MPAARLPEQFGRYRILKQLGKGGMGSVYLAQDTQLERQVALKVPNIEPGEGPGVLQRFFREARAAAGLNHPNLCQVYDVGDQDGIPYLTMAFIEGRTLAVILGDGESLPWTAVVRLVRAVALAMQEAHVRGVVHRDLKPSNIMINQRGEPVVMDFGLVLQSNRSSARLTQLGSLLGTPAYMPPEQVKGQVDAMGPGCDIYSLGVILYEMLTGHVPFDGPPAAIVAQILTQPPPPPSVHRPGLDPRLEAICLRAIQKDIAARYASMNEFAEALGDYLKPASPPVATAAPVNDMKMAAPATAKPAYRVDATAIERRRETGYAKGRPTTPRRKESGRESDAVIVLPRAETLRAVRGGGYACLTLLAIAALVPVLGLAVWLATLIWSGQGPIAALPPKDSKPPPSVKNVKDGPLARKDEKPNGSPPAKKIIDPPPAVEVVAPLPIAPGVDLLRIDTAIARGVAHLKNRQQPDGSWSAQQFPVGYTALAGLALLECKVPADDPAIKKAAQRIRSTALEENTTYAGSLAILFLDRLGDPKDRDLIRTLALRLLSGQTSQGGWGYVYQNLSPNAAQQYDTYLRSHWPWSAGQPRPAGFPSQIKGQPAKNLPAINWQSLPLAELSWNKGLPWNKGDGPGGVVAEDNSNTQFALLGLWAARRHDVAVECPVLFASHRFKVSQNADGGWGYTAGGLASTKTMTCAGLFGLAMGRGVIPAGAGEGKTKDIAIEKGLSLLGLFIGDLSKDADARHNMQNLYFLWGVERVAMAYDLKTIGGKDWYAWGAQVLLANQQANGSWTDGKYSGATEHVDTCFALFFLGRSNLAPDLTENVRLSLVVRDPSAK